MRRIRSTLMPALLLLAMHRVQAQDNSAAQLHALVNGLTVTPRVLIIGARPNDADEDLIAWLALGHHVETGFLSLTRGESAPNYTGLESGATLGAVHVSETLAARRIDGGEQFFTRAFDFGAARGAAGAFRQWDHATLLGDAVTIVRTFRPHVIMAHYAVADSVDRDGQYQVSAIIAREVFDAAMDTVRFPTKDFGLPWSPQSLFEPGPGVAINAGDYDQLLGQTYASIAIESRAQLRSFGFQVSPWQVTPSTQWRRIATRVADSTSGAAATIFAGIDTTFIRLNKDVPRDTFSAARVSLLDQVPGILAYADSARLNLDVTNPSTVIPYLRRLSELVSAARAALSGCRHPARDAAVSVSNRKCQPQWLDLDASLDLVQRRSADALLAAAGVTYESVSDREFLAGGDSARVTITIRNNGDSLVRVNDIQITGAPSERLREPLRVPSHGSVSLQRSVVTIAYAHPWWIFKRVENFYPASTTGRDGVPRPGLFMREFALASHAIPENIRRLSDVTATITIGSTTLTSSIGPVVFKTAEPAIGLQDRMMSGVTPVTIGFERPLEWAQAGKPLKKQVHVILRSFSDKPQTFALRSPPSSRAVKIDSLPPSVTLLPREVREVTMAIRGTPDNTTRYDLELKGASRSDTFNVGFRTAQYSYIPPLHLFRESTISILGVDVEIPSHLSVAYIRGVGDDADVALKQLGIPTYTFNTEGLARFEINVLSTVVIGPDAFRVDRGLVTQMPRLTEFARKGGTVVILGNPDAVSQPGVLPFGVSFARPFPEQVAISAAPVTVKDPTARVLAWPNVIGDKDWTYWTGARALSVPTAVDANYSRPLEMHDPEQKDNANSLLIATVGKGRIVYTSLTLTQQITNAVPGAMRLFVNLLSAGLPIESKTATEARPKRAL